MRPFALLILLSAAVPAFAQVPTPPKPAPASSTTPASNPVFDSLIGRPQIVRITKQDGTRFLGHVVGGDHGIYIVQTFHFAGPPRVNSAPVNSAPVNSAPVNSVRVGSRRVNSARVGPRTPRSMPPRRIVRTYFDTTLEDNKAIPLLLAGVAGSNVHPREIPEKREMLTARDVREIQALSPPSTRPGAPVAAVGPPNGPPTPGPQGAWTLTTLWPVARDTSSALNQSHPRRRSVP